MAPKKAMECAASDVALVVENAPHLLMAEAPPTNVAQAFGRPSMAPSKCSSNAGVGARRVDGPLI